MQHHKRNHIQIPLKNNKKSEPPSFGCPNFGVHFILLLLRFLFLDI